MALHDSAGPNEHVKLPLYGLSSAEGFTLAAMTAAQKFQAKTDLPNAIVQVGLTGNDKGPNWVHVLYQCVRYESPPIFN